MSKRFNNNINKRNKPMYLTSVVRLQIRGLLACRQYTRVYLSACTNTTQQIDSEAQFYSKIHASAIALATVICLASPRTHRHTSLTVSSVALATVINYLRSQRTHRASASGFVHYTLNMSTCEYFHSLYSFNLLSKYYFCFVMLINLAAGGPPCFHSTPTEIILL